MQMTQHGTRHAFARLSNDQPISQLVQTMNAGGAQRVIDLRDWTGQELVVLPPEDCAESFHMRCARL